MEYSNISLRHKNRLASARATDSINSFFPKNCSDHFEIYDEDTEMIEKTEIEETFYSDERCVFEDSDNFHSDSSDNDSESDFDDSMFLSKIAVLRLRLSQIFLKYAVSKTMVADILSCLREFGIDLPKTKAGLIQKKKDSAKSRVMTPGNFMYYGIAPQLARFNFKSLSSPEILECDFNIDGLPLYKSSKKCVWPIMGSVVGQRNIPPFVVAIYEGPSHSNSSDEFFKDFAAELDDLQRNGVRVGRELVLTKFHCRAFI